MDANKKRTLPNWVRDGVITSSDFHSIVNTGKVAAKNARTQLVAYSQLQTWKVV